MRLLPAAILCALAASLAAQEPVDRAMNAKIRAEGLERSQVAAMFDTLATVIGPRLTGSVAFNRAAEYAKQKLQQFGADALHVGTWPFGRSWELDRFSIEMVEPRYMPLLGFPEAWSPSTPGEILASPAFIAGKTPEQVQQASPKLKGGILMQQPVMTNFITADRVQPTDP